MAVMDTVMLGLIGLSIVMQRDVVETMCEVARRGKGGLGEEEEEEEEAGGGRAGGLGRRGGIGGAASATGTTTRPVMGVGAEETRPFARA